jgi:hypothetical protein
MTEAQRRLVASGIALVALAIGWAMIAPIIFGDEYTMGRILCGFLGGGIAGLICARWVMKGIER